MIRVAVVWGMLLISGCAMFRALPFTEETKKYQTAQAYLEQGNYKASYEFYQAISASRSPWAEEAKFNAAYVLLYYKNPEKNYAAAERQLEDFLTAYPNSKFADKALTWIAMLKMFHQTKAGDLSKEIVTLAARVQDATRALKKAEIEEEHLKSQKETLLVERAALAARVDFLLNEKEALIRKNTELAKDAETLTKDKAALTKRIDILNKEKKTLAESKAALEKMLHDLTMVDVKMEKQRKKIKKEEAK